MPDAPRNAIVPGEVARRALVVSLVGLALLVLVLALWKIRLIIILLFFAIVVASAMRPGVEALRRRGLPRSAGVAVHYVALAGLIALLLAFAVPRALTEVEQAISALPKTKSELRQEATESQGIKHDLLLGLERRLEALPSREKLVEPGVEVSRHAIEIVVGIFFVFASAAYWIFERERLERVVLSFIPRRKHKIVSDSWELIDLKLGAFVRGQLLLVVLVGAVLSLLFWVIGEPYWLLVGVFAGIVEIVPVVGPLAAGALAVAVGLTASPTTALYAGLAVLIVRLLEDYLVMPRVLGDAVGLSPSSSPSLPQVSSSVASPPCSRYHLLLCSRPCSTCSSSRRIRRRRTFPTSFSPRPTARASNGRHGKGRSCRGAV
jgi:predicted PurR-regulated permease PerM